MEFCKAFNAKTNKQMGVQLPTIITVYSDRSFSFVTKTPPASYLLKEKLKLKKGSSKPGHDVAGSVGDKIVKEIYEEKERGYHRSFFRMLVRTIEGSVRSMGLKLDY